MTRLRKLMLDELERRNYAKSTADAYVHALKEFAAYFHRPPDQLGSKEVSQFQLHLLRDLKLEIQPWPLPHHRKTQGFRPKSPQALDPEKSPFLPECDDGLM